MKILLVDDHAIVRAGLRRLLDTLQGVQIVEAEDGREALAILRVHRPDLVMLDLNLPGIGGLELLRRLLAECPGVKVIVLSMHAATVYAAKAMQAGAVGYLSKNVPPEELLRAVEKVAAGGRHIEHEIAQELALQSAGQASEAPLLSDRDLEIMRLLGAGRSLSEIADAFGLSYKTVANICSQMKAKLGISRTSDLIRLALERSASNLAVF